jgi:hypothetical protein
MSVEADGDVLVTGMDLNAFVAGERPHVDGHGFAGIVRRLGEGGGEVGAANFFEACCFGVV